MNWTAVWPWATLALLGVYHGVNPGMGWLFAVGRGLQERRRSAVLGALLPIALGHELSIVLVVAAVVLTQTLVPPHPVRLAAAQAPAGCAAGPLAPPPAPPRRPRHAAEA